MRDFFISYNNLDRAWAEWIDRELRMAGYSTVLPASDFGPGCNFILEMQKATEDAERTIAVLSPSYLAALYTQPEWAAALARDPTGEKRAFVPVRVAACEPKGLLAQVVYVELVDLTEEAARKTLLDGLVRGRREPIEARPSSVCCRARKRIFRSKVAAGVAAAAIITGTGLLSLWALTSRHRGAAPQPGTSIEIMGIRAGPGYVTAGETVHLEATYAVVAPNPDQEVLLTETRSVALAGSRVSETVTSVRRLPGGPYTSREPLALDADAAAGVYEYLFKAAAGPVTAQERTYFAVAALGQEALRIEVVDVATGPRTVAQGGVVYLEATYALLAPDPTQEVEVTETRLVTRHGIKVAEAPHIVKRVSGLYTSRVPVTLAGDALTGVYEYAFALTAGGITQQRKTTFTVATPGAEESQIAPSQVFAALFSISLHAEPDASSDAVGAAPRGTVLQVVGREGHWYRVRMADGTTGWVLKAFTSATRP